MALICLIVYKHFAVSCMEKQVQAGAKSHISCAEIVQF